MTAHPAKHRVRMLGVDIDNVSMDRALADILAAATEPAPPRIFFFVNAHCLNVAGGRADYREALRDAAAVYGDGVGVRLAGWLLGRPVRDNVNGTDLLPRLCEEAARRGLSLFLLGAQPGVAEEMARRLRERWPTLRIAGTRHGYFTPTEEPALLDEIAASGAHLLLVALGVPAQELWLTRTRARLKAGAALGVGGLFDFYSGRVARAPRWMRRAGLEWFWRLLQEPRRLARRYLVGNPLFLLRVLGQRVRGRDPTAP